MVEGGRKGREGQGIVEGGSSRGKEKGGCEREGCQACVGQVEGTLWKFVDSGVDMRFQPLYLFFALYYCSCVLHDEAYQ